VKKMLLIIIALAAASVLGGCVMVHEGHRAEGYRHFDGPPAGVIVVPGPPPHHHHHGW
jgi:hypothetical protein